MAVANPAPVNGHGRSIESNSRGEIPRRRSDPDDAADESEPVGAHRRATSRTPIVAERPAGEKHHHQRYENATLRPLRDSALRIELKIVRCAGVCSGDGSGDVLRRVSGQLELPEIEAKHACPAK